MRLVAYQDWKDTAQVQNVTEFTILKLTVIGSVVNLQYNKT